MAVTAWKSPSANSGSDFTNTTNAYTSDDSYATNGNRAGTAAFTGFGFSIPDNATIDGVEVTLEHKVSANTANIILFLRNNSNSTYPFLGDTSPTNDKSTSSTTDTTTTFGSSTYLWNASLTPSVVNASDFGVYMSGEPSSPFPSFTYSLDCIQMRIHYTVSAINPLPGVIFSS